MHNQMCGISRTPSTCMNNKSNLNPNSNIKTTVFLKHKKDTKRIQQQE